MKRRMISCQYISFSLIFLPSLSLLCFHKVRYEWHCMFSVPWVRIRACLRWKVRAEYKHVSDSNLSGTNHINVVRKYVVAYSFLDNSIPAPVSVINKTIEEDRFDIPDVPMELDWSLRYGDSHLVSRFSYFSDMALSSIELPVFCGRFLLEKMLCTPPSSSSYRSVSLRNFVPTASVELDFHALCIFWRSLDNCIFLLVSFSEILTIGAV